MGYFTTIHIVTVENKDQTLEKRMWFWDDTEGRDMYESAVDEVGDNRIVTLYSIDVQDRINEEVDRLMSNRHSYSTPTPLQELRSNRQAPGETEATWGELEFRPEGVFTIERTLSPDYWPYTVERYGVDGWRVIDNTSGTPISIITPMAGGTAFKVVVNGYSQITKFSNLRGAVIHAATEYNGV